VKIQSVRGLAVAAIAVAPFVAFALPAHADDVTVTATTAAPTTDTTAATTDTTVSPAPYEDPSTSTDPTTDPTATTDTTVATDTTTTTVDTTPVTDPTSTTDTTADTTTTTTPVDTTPTTVPDSVPPVVVPPTDPPNQTGGGSTTGGSGTGSSSSASGSTTKKTTTTTAPPEVNLVVGTSSKQVSNLATAPNVIDALQATVRVPVPPLVGKTFGAAVHAGSELSAQLQDAFDPRAADSSWGLGSAAPRFGPWIVLLVVAWLVRMVAASVLADRTAGPRRRRWTLL
jgi:hypothetical protein